MSKSAPKPRFELQHTSGVEISTEELIADLNRVAEITGRGTVTQHEYRSLGRYHDTTVSRRFVSWNEALRQSGLITSNEVNIDPVLLFENIEQLWISLGRQPRKRDLSTNQSRYSEGPYYRAFGSWRKSLEAFVQYMNDDVAGELRIAGSETSQTQSCHIGNLPQPQHQRRTNREISGRLRLSVLLRDGFRCQSCGRSPINCPGIELHVDHIVPWSKGGETVADNLQTKCKECNLGKGNAFDQ